MNTLPFTITKSDATVSTIPKIGVCLASDENVLNVTEATLKNLFRARTFFLRNNEQPRAADN